MWLRPRRRKLVVWSQSAGSAARHSAARHSAARHSAARHSAVRYGGPRTTRTRRVPLWVRNGALLAAIGLVGLARGMRARWRPLLPGVVLTVAGVIMRASPASVILLPGMLLLLHALLIPAAPEEDRIRLEHELGEYSTPAQRRDLEAVLDRYPDGITRELRDILGRQAVAADVNRFPAAGRS